MGHDVDELAKTAQDRMKQAGHLETEEGLEDSGFTYKINNRSYTDRFHRDFRYFTAAQVVRKAEQDIQETPIVIRQQVIFIDLAN